MKFGWYQLVVIPFLILGNMIKAQNGNGNIPLANFNKMNERGYKLSASKSIVRGSSYSPVCPKVFPTLKNANSVL